MGEILKVENLKTYFPIRSGLFFRISGYVRAVDGVNLEVKANETFGLVGESGCGKTTLGRTILRLVKPTDGRIFFEGQDITRIKGKKLREIRRTMQIIFQDPYTSLHPRKMIKDIVGEPLKIHTNMKDHEIKEKVVETLQLVGLSEEHIYRYPHEFSGGQRQRIAIARALILRPKFLVLDEPTSALDVSVQAKILNLLNILKQKFGLTYFLISHDLSIIDYMSDRVAVMYLGKIVELADKEKLFQSPLHPYTKALITSIPIPDPRAKKRKKRLTLKGEPPSPVNPPSGCRFHTRCPFAKPLCEKEEPALLEVDSQHFVACHFWEEISNEKL